MGFFRGKTAIVTGAGSGIGRALALALADGGCKVVVTDIVEDRLNTVVEELNGKGVEAGGYLVDHSKAEAVAALAEKFFEEWGHVDVLCSNAGVGCGARFEETTLEDWDWVLKINLWGAIYMMHYFVPKMIERKQGSILLTASDAGLVSVPGMLAYQVSKHGVMGLGTTLRAELWPYNIKVSMLCPAIVNTNIITDGKVSLCKDDGSSAKEDVMKFYQKHGVDPSVVADAGLSALEKDRTITIVPWVQSGPLYLLWRLSPALYFGVLRFAHKRGWLEQLFGIK